MRSWPRSPRRRAFDLLDQISRKVPPADKIKLDIAELDIRPKKTFIKGTVDTAAAVDEMATKLKEIDCFDDVTKGAITEVSGGAKQFTLTIGAEVPVSAFANLRQIGGRAVRWPAELFPVRVGALGAAHAAAGRSACCRPSSPC